MSETGFFGLLPLGPVRSKLRNLLGGKVGGQYFGDPQDYITPDESEVRVAAEEILSTLPVNPSAKEKILSTYNWFRDHIRYITDKKTMGVEEHWQKPAETISVGWGDCEDQAFLGSSILLAMGLPKDSVRVTFGFPNGGMGHAWAEVLFNGQWRPFDPTSPEGFKIEYTLTSPGEHRTVFRPFKYTYAR